MKPGDKRANNKGNKAWGNFKFGNKMENNIEDKTYWEKRKKSDTRMDWRNGGKTWIDEYVSSKDHPHRQLMAYAVGKCEPFDTILEIGCNTGPNISLLRDKFPHLKDYNLYGIDVNKDTIKMAKKILPGVNWKVASVADIPYADKSFDISILDAVLMYVGPAEIEMAMKEIDRVTKKSVIICDWYDEDSVEGVINGFHWIRNYEKILISLGYKVEKIKITKEVWPSENWSTFGYIFIGTRVI